MSTHGWEDDDNFIAYGVLRDSPEGWQIAKEQIEREQIEREEKAKQARIDADPWLSLQQKREQLHKLVINLGVAKTRARQEQDRVDDIQREINATEKAIVSLKADVNDKLQTM